MKRLIAVILTLALACAGATALAQEADAPLLGYLAPYQGEDGRCTLTAQGFAYAAIMKGAATSVVRYDADAPTAEPASTAEPAPGEAAEEPVDPAAQALASLLEQGVDGVVAVPTSRKQAVALIDQAHDAGVPIVIEGMDVSAAYPPAPVPGQDADLPYVACVDFDGSAAYAAAKWLDDYAYNPVVYHCMQPQSDPELRAGLDRFLNEGATYLQLADEYSAASDSAAGGREAIERMYLNYILFYCVLADSEALAEGCAAELRDRGESMEIAAIAHSDDALALLDSGAVNMLAGTPASVEGVASFRALYDYVSKKLLPTEEMRRITLSATTATASDRSGWIADDDFDAAYALIYADDAFTLADSAYGVAAGDGIRMGTALAQLAQGMGAEVRVRGADEVLTQEEYSAMQTLTPADRVFVALSALGGTDEIDNAAAELGLAISEDARELMDAVVARLSSLGEKEWGEVEDALGEYFSVIEVNGESMMQVTLDAPGAEIEHVRASFASSDGGMVLARLETA